MKTKRNSKNPTNKKQHSSISLKQFSSFTSKQLARYEDALEVLNLMRKGSTIKDASRQVGISVSTVKRYIRSELKIRDHRLVAKKSDGLLRKLRIYENSEEIWITVRGNIRASMIAQYHGAIGRISKNQNLKQFKYKRIRDESGQIHKLETDYNKILSILERREDAEFFTIYVRQ